MVVNVDEFGIGVGGEGWIEDDDVWWEILMNMILVG